jgi:hypothetical protein
MLVPDYIDLPVHRYGVFKFRTSNASAPNTPSSTSHRLRPSMLNLDAISRNLFGAGAPSIRSQGSSVDAFGTSSSKRSKPLSRSATESSRMSDASSEDKERAKRLSRLSSSSASDKEMEDEEELDEPGAMAQKTSPYKVRVAGEGMGQSEIDLNERLQLARKNSKSMAALSPRPSRRMDTRSQGNIRRWTSQELQVGMSTADTILANRTFYYCCYRYALIFQCLWVHLVT